MRINEILNSLGKSWERDDILLKIKNGLGPDEIVNEFLIKNQLQVKEFNALLKTSDKNLLNQIEQLSNCEAKLINEINNYSRNNKNYDSTIEKKPFLSNNKLTNKISLFMINWSNKFVVIILLAISAIALSKQAWA